MKRYISKFCRFMICISLIGLFYSCENFLDTQDYLNKNEENFPQNMQDLNQAFAAVYHVLAETQEYNNVFIGDIISDDMLGGGGPNDINFHAWDELKKINENMFGAAWNNYFKAIFRINKLLLKFDEIEFSSDEERKNALGEAHFLRAYFYFDLARMYGTVPLLTTPDRVNIPRSPAESVFAQIGSDIKIAVENMSSTSYQNTPKDRLGHATKWASQALLAKIYLFYTGYYKASSLPLTDGGTITKDYVIAQLDDCIANSGHDLLPEFRNNWPYTNELTGNDYKYNVGKNLKWIGDNDNYETVFAVKFGTTGTWENTSAANMRCLNHSFRGQSNYADVFPFGQGWGAGPVNPKFFQDWIRTEPRDVIRRNGTIINVDDPNEGIKYQDGGWEQMHDSHFWQKKYISINAWEDKANRVYNGYSILMFGGLNDYAFTSTQDQVIIRYSDVLLMHSELTETNTGLNKVRSRVKLLPVAYSLDAIKNERRFELAFEGVRYYDLLRWYGSDAGSIIDANQNNAVVLNNKKVTQINYNLTERIKATGGFLQIPLSQIDLSGQILEQSPGW